MLQETYESRIAYKLAVMTADLLEPSQKPTVPGVQPEALNHGFRMLHMGNLASLFSTLLCPICKTASLCFKETSKFSGTIGLNGRLEVTCKKCNICIAKTDTSPTVGDNNLCEANVRAVVGGRNCGMGHEKLVRFLPEWMLHSPFILKLTSE